MTNREIAEKVLTMRSEEYWQGIVTKGIDPRVDFIEQALNEKERRIAELEKTTADLLSKHLERNARIIELENEVEEQCLLNAKGQEREMSLLGRLARFERIMDKLAWALSLYTGVSDNILTSHTKETLMLLRKPEIDSIKETLDAYKAMKGE